MLAGFRLQVGAAIHGAEGDVHGGEADVCLRAQHLANSRLFTMRPRSGRHGGMRMGMIIRRLGGFL